MNDRTTDEKDIIQTRLDKLEEWRKNGQAFPNQFERTHFAENIHADFKEYDAQQLENLGLNIKVAGRIRLKRIMGKASFLHIQDMTGQIQLYVVRDNIGEDLYKNFKTWDIGDIVGAQGYLFRTKTGELSIKLNAIELLTKSIRPLPDKHHGLANTELKYRYRYLDLIVNDDSKKTFMTRSLAIQFIRNYFTERSFIEVETPMMQQIPGGASARPFSTHHNALDLPLFLRIAPELYLKRLVIGGFERVFEINRNFRNEGISTQHNPEFTMLEFYQAYSDYKDLMALTEDMLSKLVQYIKSSTSLIYQEQKISFAAPFKKMTLKEAVLYYNSQLKQQDLNCKDMLSAYLKELGFSVASHWGLGKILLEIFEKTAEHQLIQPTFITEYPTEVSPLARVNDADPSITDRFEFFIAGFEVANAFSELNDPHDQARRFKEQVLAKDHGDDEAMHYDQDYITALEYGLPPTAGEGIGIDRLIMILTDSASIRDVLLFPLMRTNTQ